MFNFFRKNTFYGLRGYRQMIYTLIPFDRAKEMIEKKEALIIDVRSKEEYDVMHIINSTNISLDELTIKIQNIDKNQKIIVYCATGTRSKKAIQLLNSLGYNNIYIWEYASLANFPYKNLILYKKLN